MIRLYAASVSGTQVTGKERPEFCFEAVGRKRLYGEAINPAFTRRKKIE